mmetsp:Transcript_26747/g.42851  ORF Transcript_26747/g.42851 Transcript_26747/m.42851 type:complete len:236 (-) Transcript_26747:1833-2540(-)
MFQGSRVAVANRVFSSACRLHNLGGDALHLLCTAVGLGLLLLLLLLTRGWPRHLVHQVEDLGRKLRGLVDVEAGREERGVKEQLGSGCSRRHARLLLRLEIQNDRRQRVDLHGLLALHVLARTVVAHSLRLHDALHVGGPAEFAGDEDAGRVGEALRYRHFLYLGAKRLRHPVRQRLVLLLDLLGLGLDVVVLFAQVQVLLADVHQRLLLKLRQVGHGDLVDGIDKEQHLKTLLR